MFPVRLRVDPGRVKTLTLGASIVDVDEMLRAWRDVKATSEGGRRVRGLGRSPSRPGTLYGAVSRLEQRGLPLQSETHTRTTKLGITPVDPGLSGGILYWDPGDAGTVAASGAQVPV